MTYQEKITVNYQEQPTVFDKLLEPIQALVEQQDRQLPRHPLQTYADQAFFRSLIY